MACYEIIRNYLKYLSKVFQKTTFKNVGGCFVKYGSDKSQQDHYF